MLTDLMGGELSVHSTPGQGSTFKVKLFLPEVVPDAAGRRTSAGTSTPAPAPRTGYLGPRLQVLVVDNEESDRLLLQRWLEPLGFDVVLATSGEDALRLLQQGLRPQAVFMDLAMPGIDGWETLRRITAMGLRGGPGVTQPAMACAVVSANAFDHGQDNDAGITPADFLVKPLRRDDLLDWLGRRLSLQWVRGEPSAPAPGAQPLITWPPAPALKPLLHSLQLGHVRGVSEQLEVLAQTHPACAGFIAHARSLLQAFRLVELEHWVSAGPDCPGADGDTAHAPN
jgi:CheY-like chemotaxis protein